MWHHARRPRGSSYANPRGISAMNVQQARLRSPTKHSTSEQFFIDRSSFPQRTAAVATAAAAEAEAVDRDARFPQKAIDAARQQKLLGVQIPQALGGDDFCHAPDQGRLPGAARQRQRLARTADAPRGVGTNAAGVIDDGGTK